MSSDNSWIDVIERKDREIARLNQELRMAHARLNRILAAAQGEIDAAPKQSLAERLRVN